MQCIHKDAVMDGKYRYLLGRIWDKEKSTCLFIMLNPSVANALQDDPTIRKCVGFADAAGCGCLVVANLFAYRATDPKELNNALDPVGPENDFIIREAALKADIIVLAYGNVTSLKRKSLHARSGEVIRLLVPYSDKLRCLGYTQSGQPLHPCRLSGSLKLKRFHA